MPEEHVSFRIFAYSIVGVLCFCVVAQAFTIGVCWSLIEQHRDGGHRNAVHWTEIREVREDIARLESLHGSKAGWVIEPVGVPRIAQGGRQR